MKKFELLLCTSLLFTFFATSNLNAQYSMTQQISSSDLMRMDNLGFSVAISDSFLLTGAWQADFGGGAVSDLAGAAYFFKKGKSGDWEEIKKLQSPNPESLGYYGCSVAIDGEFIAVGAFNEDDTLTNNFNTGAVYVYKNLGDGELEQVAHLTASDDEGGDNLGANIAISGDYVIAGAHKHDKDENAANPINDAGAVYVYQKQSDDSWLQTQKLVASDRAEGDNFGRYVDMRGDRMIIGAFNKTYEPSFYSNAGAAYIFELNSSSGEWEEVAKLLSSDLDFFDQFGWDVAIDGDWALVGARSEETIPGAGLITNAGVAYFFKRDASGNWEETQKVYAADFSQNDHFGGGLDMHGSIAVIGAENEDEDEQGSNTVSGAGSAYVFERQSNDEWIQVQKIIGENRGIDDLFGANVAIRGNQLIVGAWRADVMVGDETLTDAGSTYVFERDEILGLEILDFPYKIQFFPNPSPREIFIQTNIKENFQIHLFDQIGRKLNDYQQKASAQEPGYIWNQNLNELPPGIYFFQIILASGVSQTLKWIKN